MKQNRLQVHIYISAVQMIAQALEDVFFKDQYTDKVLQNLFKANPKCGSKDRSFIAESVYDMVRWWRLLIALSKIKSPKNRQDIYTLIGIYLWQEYDTLPGFKEFKYVPDELADVSRFSADIQASLPLWLYEKIKTELPDKYQTIIPVLNQTAPVFLRCNTLKISAKDLIQKATEEDIILEKVLPSEVCFRMNKRKNIFSSTLFKNGWIEIQDAGSQQIAEFTAVQAGMRIIDACAGAGGKSLYLAALMNNKGKIISLDTEEWKLEELQKRAKRAGVSCIETRVIDGSKTIKRLDQSADMVLLDVPCSGLGVLRRNPDAKWKLSKTYLEKVQETQAHILQTYSRMVKPGGTLIYATCSILPSENQWQIKAFDEKNADFKLIDQKTLWPVSNGHDGFFMAKFKRIS